MSLRLNWNLAIKKYAFLAFLVPCIMPFLGIYLGIIYKQANIMAYLTMIVIFILLPILDYLIGKDALNPTHSEQQLLEQQFFYRSLSLLCLPIIWATIFFGAYYFTQGSLNWWGKIGWILSIGTISGGIGIVVAHELIHKNTWYERFTGGLLLSAVCYATFKVEHVRGHHVLVATDLDASSAKKNQNLYSFLYQTLRHNFINGWRLETERLQAKNYSFFHNELIGWYAITIIFAASLWLLFGWEAFVFFFLQSIVAIILLEITNYIEHYGLRRNKTSNERYESVSHLHSWNSDYLLSNLILFHLQRHSDHHMAAKRRYQALINRKESPQLPGGYPTMILLALIPPLWFRVINPFLPQVL